MTLDRFYPIFDRAEWLPRMLPLGIKLVQLRIKDQPLDIVRSDIKIAKKLCADHGCELVVNDFWEIAIDEDCNFIHLGQEDMDTADMAAIQKAGLRIGLSTHDETELDRALSYNPEYVALGPVYPTILKKMKWTEQGLGRVTQWKKLVGDTPLVGIGGMSVERAAGVFEAGADIVSAVTDITLNATPEARLSEWVKATR